MPAAASPSWGGYADCANYPPVFKAHKLYFSQAIIWAKGHFVLTRKYRTGHAAQRAPFAWMQGKLRHA